MIETVHLFVPLHEELMALLGGLAPEDWRRPTVCREWTVADIAAHLLDGDIRKLSLVRDGHLVPPDRPIESDGDLVAFLNELNRSWVRAARRISPRLLVELLEFTGPRVAEFLAGLDPEAPALFPVSWAGDSVSPNWFDIAREYTERWHHQQQIRDAVGTAPLTSRRWLRPVLETFLRSLPHAFRDVPAPDGAVVGVRVEGDAGGDWSLARADGGWRLDESRAEAPAATVRLSDDTAWRLMTKGISSSEAAARVEWAGEVELARPFLEARAIIG